LVVKFKQIIYNFYKSSVKMLKKVKNIVEYSKKTSKQRV